MNKLKKRCITLGYCVGIVGALLTATFFLVQKKPRDMQESRIALLDVVDGNFVFRGSNPFRYQEGKAEFSYETLTSEFNKTLKHENLGLLQNYYLIDVSLLEADQVQVIEQEEAYFRQYPERGAFLHAPTFSAKMLLTPFDNAIANSVTDSYHASVTALLQQIHSLATSQPNKKVAVYVHCNSGRDRTGFVAAGYRMLFKKMSLKDAVTRNIAESGRNSEGLYEDAIKSYCLYLHADNPTSLGPKALCTAG